MLFFKCELYKIFFLRDMMDNQCANIFFTHTTAYGSYSVKFAFIERENIFLYVYPQLYFFSLVFVFLYLSPPPKFFPKLFFPKLVCFSYFYRGVVALHRGSCLYFIELNCFVFPLFSIFSYLLLRMFSVYSLIELSLSICAKKGEK